MANDGKAPATKKVDPLGAVAVPAPAQEQAADVAPPAADAAEAASPRGRPLPPRELTLPEPRGMKVPPPAPKLPAYVVEETCSVSWGPSMLRLAKGDRVCDSTHGTGACERMRAAGVKLREVG